MVVLLWQSGYYNEAFKFVIGVGTGTNNARTCMEFGYTESGRSMIIYLSWNNNGDTYTGLYNANDNNQWVHYEFDWIAASNRAIMFRNGIKFIDRALSIKLSLHHQLCIFTGGYFGCISEVLWAPYVLHTENFTPPMEPYIWPETHEILDQTDIYGN